MPFLVFLPSVLFPGTLLLAGKKGPRPWLRGEGGLPQRRPASPRQREEAGSFVLGPAREAPPPL